MFSVKEQIEKLSDYSATDGLPEWEDNFIDSIFSFMQKVSWDTLRLSEKQVEKIDSIFNRRITQGIDDRSGSLFKR